MEARIVIDRRLLRIELSRPAPSWCAKLSSPVAEPVIICFDLGADVIEIDSPAGFAKLARLIPERYSATFEALEAEDGSVVVPRPYGHVAMVYKILQKRVPASRVPRDRDAVAMAVCRAFESQRCTVTCSSTAEATVFYYGDAPTEAVRAVKVGRATFSIVRRDFWSRVKNLGGVVAVFGGLRWVSEHRLVAFFHTGVLYPLDVSLPLET